MVRDEVNSILDHGDRSESVSVNEGVGHLLCRGRKLKSWEIENMSNVPDTFMELINDYTNSSHYETHVQNEYKQLVDMIVEKVDEFCYLELENQDKEKYQEERGHDACSPLLGDKQNPTNDCEHPDRTDGEQSLKSLFEPSQVLDSIQDFDVEDPELSAEQTGKNQGGGPVFSPKNSIKDYTRGFRSFCQSLMSYLQSCEVTDEKIIIGGLNLFERIVINDVTELEKKDGFDEMERELRSKKYNLSSKL
jgi:hypothetical protein